MRCTTRSPAPCGHPKIPLDYIKRLHTLYEEWFSRYDRSPTLVLPIDRLDYIQDLVDRIEIIRTIERFL